MKAILLVPILFLALVAGVLVLLSTPAKLALDPNVKTIGNDTPLKLHVESPHGTRSLTAYLEQNNNRYKVYEVSQPAHRFLFFGKSQPAGDITVNAGKNYAPQLTDGKARVVVEAVANDFRGAHTVFTQDVDVNTKPPALVVDEFQH